MVFRYPLETHRWVQRCTLHDTVESRCFLFAYLAATFAGMSVEYSGEPLEM